MRLQDNIDELLSYLAEKSKVYIDETLTQSLDSTRIEFQNNINSSLLELEILINALEDLSYDDDGIVDANELVAKVALLEANNATNEQDILDLDNKLNQEIQDRINIMYPNGLQQSFNTTKYKTILELSTNLALLEDIVQAIEEGGTGGDNNVQADWNEIDPQADAYILNKPQWIQAVYNFYEYGGTHSNTLIRYDVYGDNTAWKAEKFYESTSLWYLNGSGDIPDTLVKCQLLTYS